MAYYENSIERYQRILGIIEPDLLKIKDPIIYDIGGYGYLTDLIRKKHGYITVHDIACSDLNTVRLELEDKSADVLLLCEVIEHLYNPDLVLKECRRILKDGGIIVLSTPNLSSWFNRILQVFGFFPMNMDISCQLRYSGKRDVLNKIPVSGVEFNPLFDVHVRLYTLSTLKILLHEWGFDVESSTGYVVSDSTNYRINLFLAMVNRFFINFPSFAQGLVIKARAV